MLTSLRIVNLKRFEDAEIPLDGSVVLVGPNNAGKTTALQALALWRTGVHTWWAQRGEGTEASQRSGVVVNRTAVTALPLPNAKQLWRDLRTHINPGSKRVHIEITVTGHDDGRDWTCGMQFDYANPELFHCRPIVATGTPPADGIPEDARRVQLAYLPPMSGLAATEPMYQPEYINALIGQGQTAGVLRNLCHHLHSESTAAWDELVELIQRQFLVTLEPPTYDSGTGNLGLAYSRVGSSAKLDITTSGRGLLQVLLIGAYMRLNPGSVIMLDEPDAHLEVLRQRQVFDTLKDVADSTGGQVISVSHSEVMMQQAFERALLVAMLGAPKKIESPQEKSQLLASLSKVDAVDYVNAEAYGYVLYLEGATDLPNLVAMARRLGHPVADELSRANIKEVGNVAGAAKEQFRALKLHTPSLKGLALFDHGVIGEHVDSPPGLDLTEWDRNEIENYMFTRDSLMKYARGHGGGATLEDDARAATWPSLMEAEIGKLIEAARALRKPEPFTDEWVVSAKASDEFLIPLLENFRDATGQPQPNGKRDMHQLVEFLEPAEFPDEVVEKLDRIALLLGVEAAE